MAIRGTSIHNIHEDVYYVSSNNTCKQHGYYGTLPTRIVM